MAESAIPLKAAVVGAGLMGRWHTIYAARSGGRITAVIDPNQQAAARLAGKSVSIYPDLESALSAQPIDVVHVCTPSESHVRLISTALQAGSHVLAEKPLAPTAGETQALLDQALQHRLVLCPVHQMPFQDGMLWAKQHLTDLGNIIAINFAIRSAGGEGRDSQQIDAISKEILPHPLSILKSLLEVQLASLRWNVQSTGAGEMRADALCGSTMISIHVSMSARPTANRCEVVGTQGTLTLNLFHGYAILQSGRVSRWHKIGQPFEESGRMGLEAGLNMMKRVINREPAYPGLLRLMHQFYAAVGSSGMNPIPPADVFDVAQACDQIQHAGAA